jgi:hypothetical protein
MTNTHGISNLRKLLSIHSNWVAHVGVSWLLLGSKNVESRRITALAVAISPQRVIPRQMVDGYSHRAGKSDTPVEAPYFGAIGL